MGGKRCVLVCAGGYNPGDLAACGIRPQEDHIVAVDGGLRRLLGEGFTPSLILGDFDSLDERDRAYLERTERETPDKVIRFPVRKDETDTQAAVRIGLERGFRDFILLGAMGGRLDHTMANIQTLLWLRRHGGTGRMKYGDTTVTVIEAERFELPEGFDGTVSLFALSDRLEGVTIRGLKYELTDVVITNDDIIGTSNETLCGGPGGGRRGVIEVRSGAALIVLTQRLHNKKDT